MAEKKKRSKGLSEKARKEVNEIVTRAIDSAIGDMAEYLNYLNSRLETTEDKLGVEAPEQFSDEIAARYGLPEPRKKKS